jgi:diacylglycerol kinase (ATP)
MINSVLKSFYYAFCGIMTAIKNERNFRIHIIAVIYVSAFSVIYKLDRLEYAVLFLTLYIVPAFELFNTAIESSVDLKEENINKFARIAKDTAAAAVLVASVISVVVAVFLFSDLKKLSGALLFLINPPILIIFIISIILSIIFIRGNFKNWNKKK